MKLSSLLGGASISGYSGSSGTIGASGISGYSATAGTSGISGYSGVGLSGYSGASAISGYSGASGVSGYSGQVGTSGYSGTSGTSGYSGISGYSGAVGTSGYSGVSGYSGASGTSGYSGVSGTSGYSGRSGYSGISGYSGFTPALPLSVANGGTGLSSWTANGVVYASGTTTLTNGSALAFDGTNLGIGATTITSKLQVEGTGETGAPTVGGAKTASIYVIANNNVSGAGGGIEFGGKTNQTFAAIKGSINNGTTNGVGELRFYTRAAIADTAMTERMVIDTGGNVGIGVTTPAAKLDILAASDQRFMVRERSTGGVVLDAVNAANNAYQLMIVNGSQVVTQTGSSERMRVDANGRLLLGFSASKTYGGTLQVATNIQTIGTAAASISDVTANDYNALDSTPTYASAVLRKFGPSAAGNLYVASAIAAAGWAEICGINVSGVAYGTNSGVPVVFGTSGSERMRITSNGGIAFGGASNYGSSGQLLKSNGDAAPTWVNQSTITAGNATTVGGFTPSQSAGVASRVVVADTNGYILNNYFNSTDDVNAGSVTYVMAKFGDNYYRSATAAKVATFISGQTMDIVGNATGLSGTPNLGYAVSAATISLTSQGGPQILGQTAGASMITFHRPGSYAVNFGLDTDNVLKVGGWSMGAVAYPILTSNNYNSYALPLSGGTLTGGLTISSGNLNFSSTGQRITGDFSNATVGNRVMVQTSTANSNTSLAVIPNGSATGSGFAAVSSSDPANASYVSVAVVGGFDVRIISAITGTGTYLPMAFWTNNTEKMRLSNAGGLSVGTTADPGAGAIYATGNITAYYSDDRLKTRLGTIENALEKVCSLTGFYYQANELAQSLGYTVKREVGVSAQDVEKVLPEIVVPAPIDEQYKTIHYEKVIPLLIEAIKELANEIKDIKKQIGM